MARKISVWSNYLPYMVTHVSFRGKHNRSKVLVLYAIYEDHFSAQSIFYALRRHISINAVRCTLYRLKRYRYIGPSKHYGGYRIYDKGRRFLYAASELGHLERYLREVPDYLQLQQ